jgi:hypothetical protein
MNWQKKGHKRTYDEQKQTSKAIHCLSHISPNTLWACSRNHHKNTMGIRKTRAFSMVTQEQYQQGGIHLQQTESNNT